MQALIDKLNDSKIFLEIAGQDLKMINRSGSPVAEDLLNEIRENKQAIIDTLAKKELFRHITSIEKDQEFYEVSNVQNQLLVLTQFKESQRAYNSCALKFAKGFIDQDIFRQSFALIIQRHEILRTVFILIDSSFRQKILTPEFVNPSIEFVDISAEKSKEELIDQYYESYANTIFDVGKAPLFRIGILRLSEDEYVLIFANHHIIFDGWSENIVFDEFVHCYNALMEGKTPQLSPLPVQYKDFAAWQNKLLREGCLEEMKNFWVSMFLEHPPMLNLNKDFTRPKLKTYAGRKLVFTFDPSLTSAIHAFNARNKITLFASLLTNLYLLLNKFSSQDDIVVGFPSAGRQHPDLEKQVGYYINTLPLRISLNENETVNDLLTRVSRLVNDAIENQLYPFDQLLDDLNIRRSPANHPLFDVLLSLNYTEEILERQRESLTGLQIRPYPTDIKATKFDLTFNFHARPQEIFFEIEYNADLFKADTVTCLGQYFLHLVNEMVSDVHQAVGSLSYHFSPGQLQELLLINETVTEYPRMATIASLFEEQVLKYPNNNAIQFENDSLTYNQLNAKVNQLARYLRNQYNISCGSKVALLVNSGPEMVIGILAILKAGAAYVPINPFDPQDRIDFILSDSDADFLLTTSDLLVTVAGFFKGSVFALDIQLELLTEESGNPGFVTGPKDVAYIMYTSGSTGFPKGVVINHKNIIRLVRNTNYTSITDRHTLIQLSNYSFDGSVYEIFGALLNGASLVLISRNTLLTSELLVEAIRKHGVDIMFITTAMFNNIVDLSPEVIACFEKIYFGGENVSVPHVRKALQNRKNTDSIVHVYGPTEGTTFSTYYVIEEIEENVQTIPIGIPISNTQVYILDKDMNLLPRGITGEIYVGGDGLATGYWKDSEQTKKKFIVNLFDPGAQEILYKTGDLGRWSQTGNIIFEGRKDNQVKLRGHRIELDEIFHTILKHERVVNAIVLLKKGATGKELVVYYSLHQPVSTSELRSFMGTFLPEYMVPGLFVEVEDFPLNKNGKIDQEKLLAIEIRNNPTKDFEAPQNEIHEKLVELWQTVLPGNKIGIRDNFFELGGDSIKAIRLVVAINKCFSASIEVKDIFMFPDIASISSLLEGKKDDKQKTNFELEDYLSQFRNDALENVFPASQIQKGMIYHGLLDETGDTYHDQLYYQIEDNTFDVTSFRESFRILQIKHPLLRTSFLFHETEHLQLVHKMDDLDIDFSVQDISDRDQEAQKEFLEEYLRKDRKQPFDISKPGLWRVRIFLLSGSEIGILFICHHAIIDGWSNASLMTELSHIYCELKESGTYPVVPLKSSYKDYVIEQISMSSNQAAHEFWINYLRDAQRTELPLSKVHTGIDSGEAGFHTFFISSKGMGETNFKIIHLAALCQLVRFSVNTQDVVVGLVANGRPEIDDMDKVIGCFLNTVPFRVKDFNKSNKDFLDHIGNLVSESKQFDKLSLFDISNLIEPGSGQQNKLFDITFNYVDFHIYEQLHPAIRVKDPLVREFNKSNTLFNTTVARLADGFEITFEYPKHLYSQLEIEKLGRYYKIILTSLVESAFISYSDLVEPHERMQLLQGFNDTAASHKNAKCICETIAGHSSDSVAVICDGEELTYRTLNEQSNIVANYLKEHANEPVAVLMDRSAKMLVSLLGILKSGAIYLPIHVDADIDRIAFILKDAHCKLLLVDKIYTGLEFPPVVFDDIIKAGKDMTEPVISRHNSDTAYIMYTSGSTGRPKGVKISHGSLLNFLLSMQNNPGMEKTDTLLAITNYIFDISLLELLLPLYCGARVIIATREQVENTNLFIEVFEEYSPTIVQATPGMWSLIIQGGWKGSPALKILSGGEYLNRELANRLLKSSRSVWNLYGPTETTIWSAVMQLSQPLPVTIPLGVPVRNTCIYVLNDQLELLPVGVTGNIYIGGEGVAQGYVNLPELTASKFISNPFIQDSTMYSTGDKGYWGTDGNLYFAGRDDKQVKLRGHRIELGEIESCLVEFGIPTAKAVIAGEGQSAAIAVYYEGEEYDTKHVETFLRKRLLPAMMPSFYVRMDKLPLNPSGKLDRKKLPQPKHSPLNHLTEEISPFEVALIKLIKALFPGKEVTRHSNFFDLGGNSMLAIRLVSKLEAITGIRTGIRTIFENPSVAALASELEKKKNRAKASLLIPAAMPSSYPLSHIQKRFWILSQLNNTLNAYHIVNAFEVTGQLDVDVLGQAFYRLIERHEILRTHFRWEKDTINQHVYPAERSSFKIRIIDNVEISTFREADDKEIFSFVEGQALFRTTLIRKDPDTALLLFTVHHIICDAESLNILFNELLLLYDSIKGNSGINLPALPFQFKEYALWESEFLITPEAARMKKYWQDQFARPVPKMIFPTDYPVNDQRSFEGAEMIFEIEAGIAQKLIAFSKESEVSLFTLLFASVNLLLNKYTGQHDLVVGVPVSTRIYEELTNQVGPYINTIPVRLTIDSPELSVRNLLEISKRTLVDGYENAAWPYDLIFEDVEDLPFDVMVSYSEDNEEEQAVHLSDLRLNKIHLPNTASQFVLAVDFSKEGDTVKGVINYDTSLLKEVSISLLKERLLRIINLVISRPDESIKNIDPDDFLRLKHKKEEMSFDY